MKHATLWAFMSLLITVAALAQQPMQMQHPMQQPTQQHMQMSMPMADCQAMMQEQQKMMADLSAMDQKLDGLVAEMNRAKGSKKVDSMAAVLNELVAQRKSMRVDMMKMHSDMMSHMMQHMQSGMMSAMQQMSACPMMQKSQ